MLDFLNISNLKKEKDELKENLSQLIKEEEKLKNNMQNLLNEIKELERKKDKLDKELLNREEFFVDSELKHIDTLSGLEFEEYCSNLLNQIGYITRITKASQDNGGDIVAQKDDTSYIIQCKHYSDTVGNKAIQEVYAAKGIYKVDKAIVMTNNFFTSQAQKESELLNVILWNRDYLKILIATSYHFTIKNLDTNKVSFEYANKFDREKDISDEEDDVDPLLNEAIEVVIDIGQASTSFIQRRFKVGYARAGRIIDQMEAIGIISGYEGSNPRQVLMSKERWKELNKM